MADPESNPMSSDPEVLLFETSPDGSLDAIVQSNGLSVHLFLNDPRGDFGTRACWVRNLIPAPFELSASALAGEEPPLLPRFCVAHPQGAPLPAKDALRITWFEEGNGIALWEHSELLAVIPPWSGRDGFHGYARDCLSENEICWPMPQLPALHERIRRADEFWEACRRPEYSAKLAGDVRRELVGRYGDEVQSFQVDPQGWPPVQILKFSGTEGSVFVSCGMSLRPQPNVELAEKKPSASRRIELGLVMSPRHVRGDESAAVELLAGQVRYPWRRWTWLGHGHLSKLMSPTGPPRHLLFVSERSWREEVVRFRGDPVHIVWLIALSDEEFARGANDLPGLIDDCIAQHRAGFDKGG